MSDTKEAAASNIAGWDIEEEKFGPQGDGVESSDDSDESQLPLLHSKASEGRLEECRQLLQSSDTDVNEVDSKGQTALHLASDPAIVSLLLEKGCDPNAQNENGWTPLHMAAGYGHRDKVKLLLDAGASPTVKDENNRTPLIKAAEHPDLQIVQWLVENGANVNDETSEKETALFNAVYYSHVPIAAYLLENGAKMTTPLSSENWTLLFPACGTDDRTGDTDLIELLIKHGLSVNAARTLTGNTPLHHAAVSSDTAVINVLLNYGADIDAVNLLGQTPLLYCESRFSALTEFHQDEMNRQKAAFDVLLDRGANIDFQDMNGFSALHHSILYIGDTARHLVSRKADVTLKDRFGASPLNLLTGWRSEVDFFKTLIEDLDKKVINDRDLFGSTLLHWAAWHSNVEAIRFLLDKGADKNAVDHGGHTAGEIAWLRGDQETYQLLQVEETWSDLWTANADDIGGYYRACWLPDKGFPVSEYKNPADLLKAIQRIPDVDQYLLSVLRRPGLGMLPPWDEVDQIQQAATTLVCAVLEQVGKKDERFLSTAVLSGSMTEGTKCEYPDEFDFLCILENLSTWCEPDDSEAPPGFTEIRKKTPVGAGFQVDKDPYEEFFDTELLLNRDELQHAFAQVVQETFLSKDVWLIPGLQFTIDREQFTEMKNVATVVQVMWRGERFKEMSLSIDIVAALKLDKWPKHAPKSNPIIGGKLEDFDCYVVFKEPRLEGFDQDAIDNTYFRVSFSAVETHTLQNTPSFCREALTLSKTIVKSVCAALVFNFSDSYESDGMSEVISTYMIKTSFFRVLETLGIEKLSRESPTHTTLRLVRAVFKELEKAFDQECLPAFFIPYNLIYRNPDASKVWGDIEENDEDGTPEGVHVVRQKLIHLLNEVLWTKKEEATPSD